MATLYFKVSSDWQEVVRLRQECEKLESQLKKMDSRAAPAATKALETQLASTKQQMMGLVTEAAKAGAEIENGFKKKIYDASQTVNGLSEKIIAQRAVIKDIEFDVKRLGDAYRAALKNSPIGASGKLSEYNAARKALDEEKAALFGLTQQQAEARLSVKKLRDEYSLYKKEAGDTVEINNGLSVSWKKMLGVIGGVAALKQLGSEIIRVRGEFQSMQTAIETMVGKDMAGVLIPQIKELAKISPLTLSDMVNAEKMMLGFNIQAEDTIRYLQALSDISMGDGVKFKSLTLAFSQMSAAGKLMGQDLNQMINAGFNPLQIIAEKTGKSIATLKDEMSKGAVSAEMVQQAFIDATSAGGKFYQMSENASKTINGQLSMMQDALDAAFNEIGQASEGVIMGAIQTSTSLIQNYETVGKVLAGLVATYGVYRTAVMLATIATSKHTIAEVALTNARVIARKAQLLLNAAMLTNPYVAVATVVAALVATMWTLSDSTSAASKATREYNQAKEEAAKKDEEHKRKIEELLTVARDESLATLTRQKSLETLREEYPKIFEQYDIEKLKLEDILDIKRRINEEDSKRASQNTRDIYYSLRESVSNRSRYLQLFDNPELRKNMSDKDMSIWRMYAGNQSYVEVREEMEKEAELLKKYQKDVFSDNTNSFLGNIKNMTDKDISSALDEITISMKALGDAGKDAMAIVTSVGGEVSLGQLKTIQSALETEQKSRADRTTYAEDYEQARKDWEEAKKELQKIEEDKDKFTSEQYEKAKKRVEAAEKAYKSLGGVTGTELSKQQKEDEKRKKAQQKLSDELLSLQEKNQQAEIDLMKESTEKKLKQIEADYEAQRNAIAKQERDWAKENKEAGVADVNANGLTSDQQEEIDRANELSAKQRTKQVLEVYKAEFYAMRDNLAEYGNYQQQKLAIAQEYAEKIEAAQSQGERSSLEKERDNRLARIETQHLKSEIDWNVAFGEFGGMFADVVRPVFEQIKQYMQTNEFKNADHDSQQVLVEAVRQMEESLGGASKVSFKKLASDMDAYRKSIVQLRTAQGQYQDAYNELNEAQEAYKTALEEGTEAEQEAAKKAVNEAQNKVDAASVVVNALQESSDKAKVAITDTANTLKESMNGVVSGLQQLTSGSLRGAYDGLIEFGKSAKNISQLGKVGDAMGTIAKGLENVPIVGWIASILDVLKDGLTDFIQTIHDSATSAVTNIFDDVFSGELFKQGFNNTLESIEKTFGMFGINFSFSGSNAKEVQATIDRLTDRNEALQSSIDALNETMKEARGAQSVQAAKQAEEYQKEVNQNYLEMAMAQAGYHGSHHSWNYYWGGFSKEQIDKLSEQIGREWSGSLWDLSPEEMQVLKGNVDMWEQIQNTGEGGYGGRLTEKLDDNIDQAGKLDEITETLRESLTQISFDSMYDSFIDNLMNMEYSAEDAADNIAEYFMRAMLSNKIGEMYADQLEGWYKKFATAMEDGTLDNDEMNALRDEYLGYVEDALKLRDDLAAATGYDQTGKNEQQSASRGGYETMTQDQATELSGRFTALYESNLRLEQTGDRTAGIADEVRSIIAQSYIELQQINENTGAIVKPIQQMQRDIEEVKRNTSRI